MITSPVRNPTAGLLTSRDFESMTARMVLGRSADELLATLPERASGYLAVLPTSIWTRIRGTMKATFGAHAVRWTALDGSPVSPVHIVASDEKLCWTMVDWNCSTETAALTGTSTVETGSRFDSRTAAGVGTEIADTYTGVRYPAGRLAARLAELVQDGNQARWELTVHFEAMVHSVIAEKIRAKEGDLRIRGMFDDASKASIASMLMFGSEDRPSTVLKLVDAYASDERPLKVSLARAVYVAVARDAGDIIAQISGDTPIVAAFRAHVRDEHGIQSTSQLLPRIDEMIVSFNAQRPVKRRIGLRRATRAFEAAISPLAASRAVHDRLGF